MVGYITERARDGGELMAITYKNNVSKVKSKVSDVTLSDIVDGMPRMVFIFQCSPTPSSSVSFGGNAMTLMKSLLQTKWGEYLNLWYYIVPDSMSGGTYTVTNNNGINMGYTQIDGIDTTVIYENYQYYQSGSNTAKQTVTPSITARSNSVLLGAYGFATETGPRSVTFNTDTTRLCQPGSWNASGLLWHPQNGGSDVLAAYWTGTAQKNAIWGVALVPYQPVSNTQAIWWG